MSAPRLTEPRGASAGGQDPRGKGSLKSVLPPDAEDRPGLLEVQLPLPERLVILATETVHGAGDQLARDLADLEPPALGAVVDPEAVGPEFRLAGEEPYTEGSSGPKKGPPALIAPLASLPRYLFLLTAHSISAGRYSLA